MSSWLFTQYQAKTEPPAQSAQPGMAYESPWHYAWSEPVRQKIAPALLVALASSGLFAPLITSFPEIITESRFHQPWSEPVRTRPILHPALNPSSFLVEAIFVETNFLSKWFEPFSEPVRAKPGLGVALQSSIVLLPRNPNENVLVSSWFANLSTPVRVPARLREGLQQYLSFVQFAPFAETIMESKFHMAWSEPQRPRVIGMAPHYQQQYFFVKIQPLPLVGPRKPLYSQATNSPGGGYPSNFWKGQT